MVLGRILVTAVAMLAMVSVGCSGGGPRKESNTAALKAEGNDNIAKADTIIQDLAQNYRIIILDYPEIQPDGSKADSQVYGASYNWKRLKTPQDRQVPKEKLAEVITLLSRVLEIDAKKGLYITNKSKIESRYQGALAYQSSLTRLEKNYGENKVFSGTDTDRVFNPPIEK